MRRDRILVCPHSSGTPQLYSCGNWDTEQSDLQLAKQGALVSTLCIVGGPFSFR